MQFTASSYQVKIVMIDRKSNFNGRNCPFPTESEYMTSYDYHILTLTFVGETVFFLRMR